MADMDKDLVLKISTDSSEATQAVDSLITSLKNLNTNLKLGNLDRFSTSLKNIADAASSLEKTGGIGKSINSIVDATSKLKDLKISKNNAIAKIVPDLKELQGVTIPDFSNLNTLADVLTKLQTVSPKKISAIATAIKDFGGNFTVNINGLDKAASAAGAVANSASGIKETTSAINGLAEAEQNASMSASQMVESQGIQQAKENVEQLSKDIQKCGESAKGVTADLQKVGKALDPEQIKEGSKAFDETADSAEKAYSPTEQLTKKYSKLLTQIKEYSSALSAMKKDPQTFDFDKFAPMTVQLAQAKKEFKEFESTFSKANNIKSGGSALAQEMQRISEKIKEVKSQMYELNDIQGSDGSTEYKSLEVRLQMLTDRYNALNEIGKKNQGVVANQKSSNIDLLASLVALSHELQTVAATFDRWGDSGIRLIKAVFSPLGLAFKDFKEKIKGISSAMKNLRTSMQKHLDKMSAFWKRAMKTFTFMLVRKAITAILNETKNAIDSLAAWSNTFGTAFNASMSEIMANASYLAKSLIAMFEPVINAIIPMLNMLVNALGRAARAIAEFFAAFTGQNYFMVAKKQVGNYTESLNKANKAQKNLTMGIDELNILSENESGGGSGGGVGGLGDGWDTAPVSDKMRKFADDIKKILDQIFEPFKKAWDKAKDHVISGFNYMKSQLKYLAQSIGRDFLKMWNEDATVDMLTNLLLILGDIEHVIGNFARKFREAWDSGNTGLHILENIRDIFAILIMHVRNVTKYMMLWSSALDFEPLLDAVEQLTEKLKKVAAFVGGVFEDVMKNVVLKYINYMITEGIPHLLDTIGEIVDAFDFVKLRHQLVPVEKAFEGLLENIHEGITNAIGNIGKAVGEFTQSEDFQKFLDTVVWFMEQITAERVEKLFTVLGDAILKVAEAVVKFVSSDDFKAFLEMLLDWFDNADPDQLSDGLLNIAKAIALFKFAGFAGKGVSNFASFLSVLASAKSSIGILTGLGTGGSAAASGLGALATALAPIAIGIGVAVIAIKSFVDSFGGIEGAAKRIKSLVDELGGAFGRLAERIGLGEKIEQVKTAFDNFNKSLGDMKNFWEVILRVIEGVAGFVGGVLLVGFDALLVAIKGILEFGKGLMDVLGGIGDIIVGLFTGDMDLAEEGALKAFKGIIEGAIGLWDTFVAPIGEMVTKVVEFFQWLFDELVGHSIVPDLVEGITKCFSWLMEQANKIWGKIKEYIINPVKEAYSKGVEKFNALKNKAIEIWGNIRSKAEELWNLVKEKIITPVQEAYNKAVEKFGFLKTKAIEIWTNIRTEAERIWNLIKEKIIDPIKKAYNDVTTKIKNIKTEAVRIWNSIKSEAERIWKEIYDKVVKPVKDAYDEVVKKFNAIKKEAGDAWSAFVKIVTESSIVKFIDGLVDSVKDVVTWFGKLKSDPVTAWNDLCSAVENSAIVTFITGLVDKVKELIDGFKNLKGAADDAKGSTDQVNAPAQAESHFKGGFVGAYATGGYPSRGTLFWAGEYGLPEMLGTVGGKTAVASSAEITGIRESVMESSIAEQNMMGQMINLLQTIALKDTSVNLDSRELLSSLNDRARRNGYNFRAATT